MSFGTENSTPVGGQTLTGFIVSKAMQSRKDAKKEDRKEKRRKKKDTEDTTQTSEKKQGLKSKLLGSFAALPNLFAGKKPETKDKPKQTRSSGGATGLAKILTNGFGSLTADTLGLSSALASITKLLNNSLKAQSFTATGVQSISAILSDQLENQSSILSTVKSLKPGGGSGGGGKSMFGSSKSAGVGGETLTGYLVRQMGLGDMAGKFVGKGVEAVKNFGKKLLGKKAPQVATQAGAKVASEGAEAAARKKLAQEIAQKGLKSKGAIIGGKYISMTAAEAAQTLAPKAAAGPLARFGGMLGGAKGAMGGMLSAAKGKVGGMVGGKLAGKAGGAIARAIPGLQTIIGLGLAGKEIMEGDMVGAGLALGSAIPGPIGWGFLAADVGREIAGPEMVDKSFGQAIGGNLGFTDAQIQQRESTMSATERAMTTLTPSFSSGGIMTSLASGGANVMIGEAAGGGGGEVVKDLRSADGRKMMSNGGASEDPGMKTSGATTLAVVDQFIKGMGPLGAPVAQALGPDIQNLSRTFGMSQTLPNLRIGGGKFKEDGNAKKTRDKFLEQLISGSLENLGAKDRDKKQTPPTTPSPQTTPQQQRQSDPNNPDTGSVSQRQQNAAAANGNGKPMDGQYRDRSGADHGRTTTNTGLRPTVDTQRTQDFTHKGDGQRYRMLLNYSTGDFEVFKVGAGPMGTNQPVDLSNPKPGGLNEAILQRAQNEAQYLYSVHAPDRGAVVRYLSPQQAAEIKAKNREHRGNKGARGGDMLSPSMPTMPRPSPVSAPVGATNIQNTSQANSITVINMNMVGGGGGSASIPVASKSSQDTSRYIQNSFPSASLAGVLCTSRSVV